MKIEALLRIAQILRTQPGYSMALSKLHARLVAELGGDVGTYAQVYRELKNRPASFMLVDGARVLPGSGDWPKQLRAAYDDALSHAGLGACVRVALTEAPPRQNDALTLASTTLGQLWPAAENDPTMRGLLERAAEQLAEISAQVTPDAAAERPTTHPRDLPQ